MLWKKMTTDFCCCGNKKKKKKRKRRRREIKIEVQNRLYKHKRKE